MVYVIKACFILVREARPVLVFYFTTRRLPLAKHLKQQGTPDDDGHSKKVDVRLYLFYFLKFISSVIPTIEYDYTSAV